MSEPRQRDRFEQLAAESSLCVVLLYNATTADFELVPPGEVAPELAENFRARGLEFGGVLGVVNGVPRAELCEPIGRSELIVQRFVFQFMLQGKSRVSICFQQPFDTHWN